MVVRLPGVGVRQFCFWFLKRGPRVWFQPEGGKMRGVMVVMATVFVALIACALPSSQGGGESHNVTQADVDGWKTELTNWGRWGPDDQLGTLNLVTPEKRREAAAVVTAGISVSLAREVLKDEAVDNPRPFVHTMSGVGSDSFEVFHHGWAHSHIDALSHVSYGPSERDDGSTDELDNRMYNGYLPDLDVVMEAGGHAFDSIYNLKDGIFTRGILMDIPRLKGVPYLEPGTPIYVEDLEAWEEEAGIKVSAGDALMIRTGRWMAREELGPFIIGRSGKSAGLHASVIPWLKERDISIIASDCALSEAPSDLPGAVHDFAQVILGTHVFDNLDFRAVSEIAAEQNRWEFLFTAAPLAVWGATGSPINPIATF